MQIELKKPKKNAAYFCDFLSKACKDRVEVKIGFFLEKKYSRIRISRKQ